MGNNSQKGRLAPFLRHYRRLLSKFEGIWGIFQAHLIPNILMQFKSNEVNDICSINRAFLLLAQFSRKQSPFHGKTPLSAPNSGFQRSYRGLWQFRVSYCHSPFLQETRTFFRASEHNPKQVLLPGDGNSVCNSRPLK